jgi:translation initiation factor IF-3
MPTDDARTKAAELGLDLVEVSPNARPPVCKIMDFGKFKYDEKKRKNEQKKRQAKVELKIIKLRPKTDTHDLAFKAKAARKFLEAGNRVQFEVRFRGRENAHPRTGRAALDKLMADLVDVAKLERAARYENRVMTMLVGPK